MNSLSTDANERDTPHSAYNRRFVLRLAAVGAVSTATAALLAACGGSSAASSTTSAAPAAAPAATTAKGATATVGTSAAAVAATPTTAPIAIGQGTEIRWQFRGSPSNLKDAQAAVKATFLPKNPTIKVVIEPAPANRDEKLVAQMIAGTAPDVFETWGDNVQQFAEKGQVLNVDPLVKQNKVDTSDFYKWQWDDFQIPIFGGPQYGGTLMRFGLPKYVNVMFCWINRTMFQQKNVKIFDVNSNQDNYATAMAALTVKENNKIKVAGAWIPMDWWDRYWYHLAMWGGFDADPKDPVKCGLGAKAAQAALEWARHLEWDQQVLLVSLSGMPQVQGNRFFNGQYAISEDGFYPFSNAEANRTAKIDWQYTPIPQGPVKRQVLGTTDGFAGWSRSKHLPEAFTLMQYLSGPDYQVAQVESTGLLPIRLSVLDKWKSICLQKYPELEKVNLDVGPQAMKAGYPGNRSFFFNTSAAQLLINPALQKLFDTPGTPTTYFQKIADQVSKREQQSLLNHKKGK